MNAATSALTGNQAKNLAILANLPPQLGQSLFDRIMGDPALVVQPKKYFSMVAFVAAKVGAGPAYTYTIPVNTQVQAFGYTQNQDMASAGQAGVIATASDTNLRTGPGQTNDNADAVIWGISASLVETSDPVLAAQVWDNCATSIAFSTQNGTPLGPLAQMPGSGGLYGQGYSKTSPNALNEFVGAQTGFVANGNPMASNQFLLPTPYRWNSVGGQNKDSNLSIQCTMTRQAQVAGLDVAAAAGIAGFTAAASASVRIRWILECVEISKTSQNF